MEIWRRRKKTKWCSNLLLIRIAILLLVSNAIVQCEDFMSVPSQDAEDFFDSEVNNIDSAKGSEDKTRYLVSKIVDSVIPISYLNTSTNYTVLSDNDLWHDLFKDCGKASTLTCVKKNVFGYLDKSVSTAGDFAVTDGLVFKRNGNEFFENKYLKSKNVNDSASRRHDRANALEEESEKQNDSSDILEEDEESSRSIDTFEGITNVLYDKGVNFVLTHDLQLQLPDTLFGGAVVRISPRALERDGGALLRVDMNSNESNGEGRILFKKHKEWKRKLLMSFFALILVIKMIKVKLMYLLPLMLGASTAKKIFLKILLFIFPAFRHLFKFCSTYHSHFSKFHHHHHQIAHHHHHHAVPVPVPVPAHPPEHYEPEQHEHIPVPHEHIPVHEEQHDVIPSGNGNWDFTGNDYHLSNRNEHYAQKAEQALASWGLGNTNGHYKDTFEANFGSSNPSSNLASHNLAYSAYANLDDHRLSGSQQPVQDPARVFYQTPNKPLNVIPNVQQLASNKRVNNLLVNLQTKLPVPEKNLFNVPQKNSIVPQLAAEPPIKQNLQIQMQNLELQQQMEHEKKQKLEQQSLEQKLMQQKIQGQNIRIQVLTPKPPMKNTLVIPVVFDPFYSPILQRIDNVFFQLGFNEEHCRERLVCSMYKNPNKFSPHSNLISVEISRDPEELQKPTVTNTAVTRFYRYVQAARDGQDQKDCISLYPTCNVNTEQGIVYSNNN